MIASCSLMVTEDTHVASDGTRLALLDHGGPVDGRGIVLVHGLASNVHIWDLVGPRLATRFRVVAYDQRSHGGSDDAAGFSFDALARDCLEVAGMLRDPIVVGHSWGASVALHAAAADPACAGVVCVDGGVFDWQAMGMDWPTTERLLTPPQIEGPEASVLDLLRAHTELPWDAAERVVRRSFVTGVDGIMRRRTPIPEHMKIVRSMWEDRLNEVHARVRCPVLFVLARNEAGGHLAGAKEAAVAEVQEANPRVEVEWIDSVHDVPLAEPAELADRIARFASD
jgi:pimeloyl-ACP methyl ester carboxylesterase